MRFSNGTFNHVSLIRAVFTSATALVLFASCSDSSAPANIQELEPNFAPRVVIPDSVKLAYQAEMAPEDVVGSRGLAASRALVPAPSASLSAAEPATYTSSTVPFASLSAAEPATYTSSTVPFAPEAMPANVVSIMEDDGFFKFYLPIGFDFEFYGNVYDKLSLNYNGFVTFGPIPSLPASQLAFYITGNIPALLHPNNMIALAWNDWDPRRAPGGIRYETRGTAPNRRFILQFTGIPEVGGSGKLTSQLVLDEGTNKVTIYTAAMSITGFKSRITQGVENAAGTEAAFGSVQNPVTQAWSSRVRGYFNLTNDAIAFTPPAPSKPLVLTAPANISAQTDAASCVANVEVGTASFGGAAYSGSVIGSRSDDAQLPLSAPYPKGVTTIAWTATGLAQAPVNQTVTVTDEENPSIPAPASIPADNDRGLATAAVSVVAPVAADNCPNVAVAGARSDGAAVSAPYPVGETTITWTATDESGNSAVATQTITVRDAEAPSLSVADISVDATMRSGAVVSFLPQAGDNVGVAGVSCTPQSGSVFPVGVTPVSCTAEDAAGNRTSESFVVTVRGVAAQIAAVIAFVEGLERHNGTANPMLNQLRHALREAESASPDVACKKMDDFMRMLGDKKLSDAPAWVIAELTADARRIMSVLGCQ